MVEKKLLFVRKKIVYKTNIINKFYRYSLVGVLNSLICLSLIFVLHNFFNLGYWPSSSLGYISGILISYKFNKNYTFEYNNKNFFTFFKFCIYVFIIFYLSFFISDFIIFSLFSGLYFNLSYKLLSNLSIFFGICFYIILNFLAMNFLIFKK